MESSRITKSTPLKNLMLGTTMQHITVRLLRSWEARNFKRNGELMSLDLLLLDEMDSLIQASIHHRRISNFKADLKIGNVFSITNFEVVQSNERYKLTDNHHTIRFTDTTTIEEITNDEISIKKEMFRLSTYGKFMSLANSNLQLPDVVGQIMSIKGFNLEDSKCTEKIVLSLMLRERTTVRLTIWDDQASDFRRRFTEAGEKNSVVLCTCVNPKIFAGTLYLNTTGATSIVFDTQVEAIKEYMKEMGIEGKTSELKIHETNADDKLESWNIGKLLQYCKSNGPQDKEVNCRATIASISTRNGWNYVSCAKCSKKLIRSDTSFVCNTCHDTNAIGILKFRIELVVTDNDNETKFVLFDRDGRKLTKETAENINTEHVMESKESSNEYLPRSVRELVGKTMDFHLKLNSFNFKTSSQTFTVIRVVEKDGNEPPKGNTHTLEENENKVEVQTDDEGMEDTATEEPLNVTNGPKNKKARLEHPTINYDATNKEGLK